MRFVEAAGLLYEQMGMPRMAGRILGWLLICDPAHQTQAELAQVLSASKGSISTMVRMLAGFGMIERTSRPGDRREYFHVTLDSLEETTDRKMRGIEVFRSLMDTGVALLARTPKARRARVEGMRDFYLFFEREMPALMTRWRAERRKR